MVGCEPEGKTFPRERRLRRRAEYLAIQGHRGGGRGGGSGSTDGGETRRRRAGRFVVLLRQRPAGLPGRLGITVASRLAKAVRRNRIRRLVREAYRTVEGLFPPDHDVVVIATTAEGAWSLGGVVEELRRWTLPRSRREPTSAPSATGGGPALSPGSRSS